MDASQLKYGYIKIGIEILNNGESQVSNNESV